MWLPESPIHAHYTEGVPNGEWASYIKTMTRGLAADQLRNFPYIVLHNPTMSFCTHVMASMGLENH